MSELALGAVDIVPVVNAIDVMSVFAPLAAAPKLVKAPIDVVAFVPPLAIGNGVPEYVIAIVPDVVIGTPDTDNNDGTVAFTDVTVPVLLVYPLGLDAG
jgi:hypothetical protein